MTASVAARERMWGDTGGVRLPTEVLAAIAERHNLRASAATRAPWTGATSSVYALGDAVLKVPHDDPSAVEAVRIDAAVSPVARTAGVRTPRLIAFDDSRTLLPTPYALYERVPGGSMATELAPEAVGHAWRELGRDLAVVHAQAAGCPPVGLRSFAQSPEVDPRPWLEHLAGAGRFNGAEARWLAGLLDRLAPAALAPIPRCFCHGDVNAANVLVDPTSSAFLAVVDWAGAGWLDPVWDFAAVSLRAVPYLLEGHRQEAPLPGDETAEARILWCHVQSVLYHLRRQAPTASAPERPSTRLLANVRRYLALTGMG